MTWSVQARVMKSAVLNIAIMSMVLLMYCMDVQAASIESLIMPGQVIEGHAKYEDGVS